MDYLLFRTLCSVVSVVFSKIKQKHKCDVQRENDRDFKR